MLCSQNVLVCLVGGIGSAWESEYRQRLVNLQVSEVIQYFGSVHSLSSHLRIPDNLIRYNSIVLLVVPERGSIAYKELLSFISGVSNSIGSLGLPCRVAC